ncbi:MAG: ester cyclase, partial [Halovenus sp.]
QFAEGGTYVDPNVGEKLQGDEIGEYVEETIEGFPDVHFEEDRVMQTEIEGEFGLVVEWTMHGTHDGPLEGLPPTGKTITLDGVDIVTISEDGITSITGYFDQQQFAQQLGLTFPAIIGQLPTLAVGAARQAL